MKSRVVAICLLVWLLAGVLPAAAQGPIVEPPDDVAPLPPSRGATLQLMEERVEVRVEGQMATTRVAQTFLNPSEWALEGEYLFPLPPDAAIRDMDMTVNGEKLEGQLLDAEQARGIYEEIVRQRMDPALLEWLGSGLFRTRIFPIPPGETRLIELEYTQLLTPEAGLFHYHFPLRQPAPGGDRPNVSVGVTLDNEAPLRAIYSPSHEVDIIREGERSAIVGWEGQAVALEEDFSLFWSVSPEEVELNLLSFKETNEEGFFLLLAAPAIEPETIVARDVVLVLDVSSSMEGEKLVQAKAALDYVLGRLNPEDRFNIVAFSTGTRPFAQSLQPVSEVEAARRWVGDLVASGSTDINRALLEAMTFVGDERPALVLFLTDGLPTMGVVDREEILRLALGSAPEQVRLFPFGVGYDVDTLLLDALAAEMRGTPGYVTPDERIDEEVSAFYEKVSAPVLSDVQVDWGGALIEEVYPSPLPDLFAGQQLVVVGRYREPGPVALTLSGTVNGQTQRFEYDDLRLAEEGENDAAFLPRLWATRKIGTLLQGIRRNGESQEAVDEIVDLAMRYGIVTPYTTFLVDEDDALPSPETGATEGFEGDEEFAEEEPAEEATSGVDAVAQSESVTELTESERGAAAPMSGGDAAEGEEAEPSVRTIGAKTFTRRDGQWVDTRFNESMERVTVPFGSDAYFELAGRSPDVARYLSIGSPLVLVVEGVAYEIVAASEVPGTSDVPDTPDTSDTSEVPAPQPTEAAPVAPAATPVATAIAAPVAGEVETAEPTSRPLMPIVAVAALLLGGVGWVLAWRRAR